MLRSSVSADMKVYALQLKQKSTAGVFHEFCEILEQLLSKIIFWGWLLLKRKQRRRRTQTDPCGFTFSHFPGQLCIRSWNNKLFSHFVYSTTVFLFFLVPDFLLKMTCQIPTTRFQSFIYQISIKNNSTKCLTLSKLFLTFSNVWSLLKISHHSPQ